MTSLSDRAHAKAERLSLGRDEAASWRAGFVHGAGWASDQDPTEAEVSAAADAMRDWEPEDVNQLSHGEIREGLARASLLAARDARRAGR